MGGTVAFTSCGKDEECVCDTASNISESEAEDAGVTLAQACSLAKIGDSSCSVE